ncbi:MAG: hypothetical protein JOZ41_05860 [Chloroflexi bacterium]|nr:hypothetical protein [Chloroflexota bacterium]
MTARTLSQFGAALGLIVLDVAWMGLGAAQAAVPTSSSERGAPSAPAVVLHLGPHQTKGWKPYHSSHADYTVTFPASWSVTERVGENGWLRTSFSPPRGGAGIAITVRPGSDAGSDLPNARCRRIQVGNLVGLSCLATTSFTRSTTFTARGKTYSISTSARPAARPDLKVYQRMVQSFRLV